MSNVINWFEIPVKNFTRATDFYSKLLDGPVMPMDQAEAGPIKNYGFLPGSGPGVVGGAIVEGEGYEPTTEGSTVFLNGGEDLNVALAKVEPAGGQVIVPKMSIGENGFIAQFIDTEGNRIALHSMN
jgi:predicted enzyme related to lactoylglutathione lyase